MKKLLVMVTLLTFLLSFAGCQTTQTGSDTTPEEVKNVLYMGTDPFSEEKLTEAIKEYEKNYTPVYVRGKTPISFSFEADFEVAGCSVVRLSKTDKNDIQVELKGYLDLYLFTSTDGKTITVPVDWWIYRKDSGVGKIPVWSYLLHVKDTDGKEHYYYFRTDYSAFIFPDNN